MRIWSIDTIVGSDRTTLNKKQVTEIAGLSNSFFDEMQKMKTE